jgi:hypothetical protein
MRQIVLFIGSFCTICQLAYSQIGNTIIYLRDSTVSTISSDTVHKELLLASQGKGILFHNIDSLSTPDSSVVDQIQDLFPNVEVTPRDTEYFVDFSLVNYPNTISAQKSSLRSNPKAKRGTEQRSVKVALKFSVDLAGNQTASSLGQSASYDVNTGTSVGIEFGKIDEHLFNFGIGIMYLIPRGFNTSEYGSFNFVPIYAVGKIKLTAQENSIIPILIGNIGYNRVFSGDANYRGLLKLSGGLYIAGGVRVEIKNIFFEGLYQSFSGSGKYDGYDDGYEEHLKMDVTYTTFSLAFGVLL